MKQIVFNIYLYNNNYLNIYINKLNYNIIKYYIINMCIRIQLNKIILKYFEKCNGHIKSGFMNCFFQLITLIT